MRSRQSSVLPFCLATRASTIRNRGRPSDSSSPRWMTSHFCQSSSGQPIASAKSMTSNPYEVSGVSSLSGGVHSLGSVLPSTALSEFVHSALSCWGIGCRPLLRCCPRTGAHLQGFERREQLGAEFVEDPLFTGVNFSGVCESQGSDRLIAWFTLLRVQGALHGLLHIHTAHCIAMQPRSTMVSCDGPYSEDARRMLPAPLLTPLSRHCSRLVEAWI